MTLGRLSLLAFAVFLTSCHDASLAVDPQVSDCGGFTRTSALVVDEVSEYCQAELLRWTYDAATSVLRLEDDRVFLNCCGEHSIDVVQDEDVYVVTETDMPVTGKGRCGCDCVFDFAIGILNVPPGLVRLRLVLDVSDEGLQTQFDGTLDLSKKSGAEILSTYPLEGLCP